MMLILKYTLFSKKKRDTGWPSPSHTNINQAARIARVWILLSTQFVHHIFVVVFIIAERRWEDSWASAAAEGTLQRCATTSESIHLLVAGIEICGSCCCSSFSSTLPALISPFAIHNTTIATNQRNDSEKIVWNKAFNSGSRIIGLSTSSPSIIEKK